MKIIYTTIVLSIMLVSVSCNDYKKEVNCEAETDAIEKFTGKLYSCQ